MKMPVRHVCIGDVIKVNREERKVENLVVYKGGLVNVAFVRNGKMKSKPYEADQMVEVVSC